MRVARLFFVMTLTFGVTFPWQACFAAKKQAEKPSFWEVESSLSPDLPPLYSNTPTPFRIEEMPEETAPVQKEMSTSQRQEFRAAEILGNLRELLSTEAAFKPDTAAITVSAMLSGAKGNAVLVENQWLSEGDIISVPVIAQENVFSLLSELEAVNGKLADVMREQVQERSVYAGSIDLKLRKISTGNVEVVDKEKNKYVIYFTRAQW